MRFPGRCPPLLSRCLPSGSCVHLPRIFLLLPFLSALLVAPPAFAQDPNLSVKLGNSDGSQAGLLSVTDNADFGGHSELTIEAWIRPALRDDAMVIVENGHSESYIFFLTVDGRLRFSPHPGATPVESTSAIPLDAWTHVAATYDGSASTLYIDGEFAATTTASGPVPDAAEPLFLGAGRTEVFGSLIPSFYWIGHLDEIRIWSKARALPDIRQDMFGPGPSGGALSDYYDGAEGSWRFQFLDAQGEHPNYLGLGDATASGTVSLDSDEFPPLQLNLAATFNGVDDRVEAFFSPDVSNGVTVEAWIHPTSFSGFPTIAGRDYETGFWLGLTPEGHVRFYPKGGIGEFVDTRDPIPLDQWTHVAASYDNDNLTQIWVNGRAVLNSHRFLGPMTDNGRLLFVGADNNAGGNPEYFFEGMIDEVRVISGRRSRTQVRQGRYFSSTSNNMRDVDGVLRPHLHVNLGEPMFGHARGSDLHLVPSGAPLFDIFHAAVEIQLPHGGDLSEHVFQQHEGKSSTATFDVELDVPKDVTIEELSVFLHLQEQTSATMLSADVVLLAPGGSPSVTLYDGGPPATAIQTVFDDASTNTLTGAHPPYLEGVQPSQALSAFDGVSSQGTWTLRTIPSGGVSKPRVQQWGLKFNDIGVTPAPSTPVQTALTHAGSNPVGGQGRFQMRLARRGHVELHLYDIRGRRVRTLVDERRPEGRYHIDWSPRDLAAGVYFARLSVDGRLAAKVLEVVVRP